MIGQKSRRAGPLRSGSNPLLHSLGQGLPRSQWCLPLPQPGPPPHPQEFRTNRKKSPRELPLLHTSHNWPSAFFLSDRGDSVALLARNQHLPLNISLGESESSERLMHTTIPFKLQLPFQAVTSLPSSERSDRECGSYERLLLVTSLRNVPSHAQRPRALRRNRHRQSRHSARGLYPHALETRARVVKPAPRWFQ